MTSAQPHETRALDRPSRGQNQPMSTEHRSARKGTDPRPNYLPLGRDAEGREHVYRPYREEIIVIRDRQRVHTAVLDDHSVEDWMRFINDRTGWTRVDYGPAPTEPERFLGGVAL